MDTPRCDQQTLVRDPADSSTLRTTLYDLIAAVGDEIAPDEEPWIAPLVMHLLRAGHARFLRDIRNDDFGGDDAAPSWLDTHTAGVHA